MRTSRLPSLLALLLALSACATPAATPGATPTVGQPGGGTFSPAPTASGDPGDSPAPSAGPTATPVSGTTYTVRRGDSLSSIARAYGTSSQQLQSWNADRYPSLATNPGIIESGWVLIVSGDPAHHTDPDADPAARRPHRRPGQAAARTNECRPDRPRPSARSPARVRESRSRSTWVAAWIRRSTS